VCAWSQLYCSDFQVSVGRIGDPCCGTEDVVDEKRLQMADGVDGWQDNSCETDGQRSLQETGGTVVVLWKSKHIF